MPRLKDNQVPSYRLHKQSGQAVVTLNGKDGKHGSAPSKSDHAAENAGRSMESHSLHLREVFD